MATRYYPAVKSPSVVIHGNLEGSWDSASIKGAAPWGPVWNSWRLSTSKADSGTQTSRIIFCNQQSNHDVFLERWLTPPLEAQSISGTFNLCFFILAQWQDFILGFTTDSVVRYRVHIYIAQGQTTTVRHTLLDKYVDSADLPKSTQTWKSLASAQSLTAGSTEAGDVIVVEMGFRIVSSPAPAPAYPPADWTRIACTGTGANNAFTDAVDGDTSSSRAPWFEFSANLTHQAVSAPPANDACADAILISSLPYQSDFIDTTQSADTNRAVWWTWIADASEKVCFNTYGSNYGTRIAVFRDGCGVLTVQGFTTTQTALATHRSMSSLMFTATAGTQYWIRVRSEASSNSATDSGGACRFAAFYRDTTPEADDLYLPAGTLAAFRNGQIVNLNSGLFGFSATGVAIDYTKRSMADINGGFHVGERILVGLHSTDLVEIFDLPTLSYGDFQNEVDWINDPWDVAITMHPAQLHVSAAGILYTGFFGNGYRYVSGIGSLPAVLDSASNDLNLSALKVISAINGDNQPGAPFADTVHQPTSEVTAPWAIALDEDTGTLYYASGGLYMPVGGQEIRTFNVNSGLQGSLFATLPVQSGVNPGAKGLQFLPGGGLLVCNSTVVHRLNADGSIALTYTPSIPVDAQTLVDVKLSEDGRYLYAVDLWSTRIFKFDILTGDEVATWQPYLQSGTLLQMAIYQPEGPEPPPPPVTPPVPTIEESTVPGNPSICIQVSRRLGDADQRIWSGEEIDLYLLQGVREMCTQNRVIWDWVYPENLPRGFSFTAKWEKAIIDLGISPVIWKYGPGDGMGDGLANYTMDDERRLYATVPPDRENTGITDEDIREGPARHTFPDEIPFLTTLGSDQQSAVSDLPHRLTEMERGLWDKRTIDASRHQVHRYGDSRYEQEQGEVYQYTWQKDGPRTFRKIRVPSALADYYEIEGLWGITRDVDDLDYVGASAEFLGPDDDPANLWGIPRQVPGEHPIGPWSTYRIWGTTRRFFRDGKNVRVEHWRIPYFDCYESELPARYRHYLVYYAMFRALSRQGPGQDMKLAGWYRQRWGAAVDRIRRRIDRQNQERTGRLGGPDGSPVQGMPPRPKLPWQYGKTVR